MSGETKAKNVPLPGATKSLQHYAGHLARARAWRNKRDEVRSIIECRICMDPNGKRWTSRSDGGHGPGSSAPFALDLWAHHLDRAHPGEVCKWSTDPNRGAAHRAWKAEEDTWYDRMRAAVEPPSD